jgi:RNA polymerase sigma-70 factor (ECF subfamily)
VSALDSENNRTTDHDLAQRTAGGDMQAFESLYRRHFRRVYALCLRMTGNTAEAEDLTQDVFTHLFRKIGSFRGEAAFTTWLHRLTVNQVLMHFRKRKVRPEQSIEELETPLDIVAGTDNKGDLPLVDRIAVQRAIAELPLGYRTILVLHDIEGYEHNEIASMLGVAEGTSKSQLHKARLKLRGLLRREAAPNPA